MTTCKMHVTKCLTSCFRPLKHFCPERPECSGFVERDSLFMLVWPVPHRPKPSALREPNDLTGSYDGGSATGLPVLPQTASETHAAVLKTRAQGCARLNTGSAARPDHPKGGCASQESLKPPWSLPCRMPIPCHTSEKPQIPSWKSERRLWGQSHGQDSGNSSSPELLQSLIIPANPSSLVATWPKARSGAEALAGDDRPFGEMSTCKGPANTLGISLFPVFLRFRCLSLSFPERV